MSQKKVRQLAYGGLLAAVIAIATAFLKIPTAIGYFHMGDGFIFLAAYLLGGPWGALAAGVGSALADLFAGYVLYAPATFVIKALMALIAGYGLQKDHSPSRMIVVYIIAEVLMVLGYFLFEWILYGAAAAAGVLISNTMQGIIGVLIGVAAVRLVERTGFRPLS